jgi:hypothetical protein
MTEIFKSSRSHKRRYVVRQLIFGLAIVASWPVYKILYLNSSVSYSYYYIIGSVWVIMSFQEAFRARVSEIEFNIETQQIVFHFAKFVSRTQQKNLLFKHAKLEVDTQVGWRGESLTVYFLRNKVEVFKIDKNKDGFSNETLISIRDLAKKLSLPISKY